jgi:hypothetical protein
MERRLRELRNSVHSECASVGASIVSIGKDGRDHFRFEIRRSNGSEFKAAFAFSPGDRRTRKNELTRLRRRLGETQA